MLSGTFDHFRQTRRADLVTVANRCAILSLQGLPWRDYTASQPGDAPSLYSSSRAASALPAAAPARGRQPARRIPLSPGSTSPTTSAAGTARTSPPKTPVHALLFMAAAMAPAAAPPTSQTRAGTGSSGHARGSAG